MAEKPGYSKNEEITGIKKIKDFKPDMGAEVSE
jgi:hypothetical protein